MATTDFVARTIAVLSAAYPSANIARETIQVYVADLSDIPDEVLDLAAADCRATCKWFPTIAEIRQAAARIQAGADSLPPALEAFGTMYKEMNDSHYHPDLAANGDPTRPVFSNAITAKIVAAMGLLYLYTSENGMSDRARFCDLYEEYARRGVRASRAGRGLAGRPGQRPDPRAHGSGDRRSRRVERRGPGWELRRQAAGYQPRPGCGPRPV